MGARTEAEEKIREDGSPKKPDGWDRVAEDWADKFLDDPTEIQAAIDLLTDQTPGSDGEPRGTIPSLVRQRRGIRIQLKISIAVDGRNSKRSKSLSEALYSVKCATDEAMAELASLKAKLGGAK